MYLKIIRDYGLESHIDLNYNKKIFNFFNFKNFKDYYNNKNSSIDFGLSGTIISFNFYFVKKIIFFGNFLKNYLFYISFFVRKSYFYSDNPKNYQISQCKSLFELGVLIIYNNLIINPYYKFIKILKIHLEQDVAKTNYNFSKKESILNFNRSNKFLLEIVTHYNMNNFYEIFLYLNNLKRTIFFLKKKKLKSFLRFDLNISLKFFFQNFNNFKIEIKNIDSVYILKNIIDFETKRQIFNIIFLKNFRNETRFYDLLKNLTYYIRKKSKLTYKYFIEIDKNYIILNNYYIKLHNYNLINYFYYKIYLKYNFNLIFSLKLNFFEILIYVFKYKKNFFLIIDKIIKLKKKKLKISLLSLIIIIKVLLNNLISIQILKKLVYVILTKKFYKTLELYKLILILKIKIKIEFLNLINYILIKNIKLTQKIFYNDKIVEYIKGIFKKYNFKINILFKILKNKILI